MVLALAPLALPFPCEVDPACSWGLGPSASEAPGVCDIPPFSVEFSARHLLKNSKTITVFNKQHLFCFIILTGAQQFAIPEGIEYGSVALRRLSACSETDLKRAALKQSSSLQATTRLGSLRFSVRSIIHLR